MTRREWLVAAAGWAATSASLAAQHGGGRTGHAPQSAEELAGPADLTLRIGALRHEIAPRRMVATLAYNGQVPGPSLRVPRGRPLTVDVFNETGTEEFVHWHGLHVPSDVDGVPEQGTPGVPPKGRRRYVFTPEPAGTRWYHSHAAAGTDLRKGTYTGQFGVMVVEDGRDQGGYDDDVAIVLHEWEPSFRRQGPRDVEFKAYSVNGRMLGAADPIRVRAGQRVLFRVVNASATLTHQLALAGHRFHVVALDGNAVPLPAPVPVLEIAPGERVDALVDMDRPGVWILGGLRTADRDRGLGIVVEYAGAAGPPRWEAPVPRPWNYALFGAPAAESVEPDARLTLAFRATGDGHHWTINGKPYPKTDPIVVEAGRRYRWTLDNQSADPHPVHLHRHTFELARVDGRPTSGIRKDVVVVPAWRQVEIDVVADQPGLSLFHCHQQFHMDNGFMALMRYAR